MFEIHIDNETLMSCNMRQLTDINLPHVLEVALVQQPPHVEMKFFFRLRLDFFGFRTVQTTVVVCLLADIDFVPEGGIMIKSIRNMVIRITNLLGVH